MWRDMPRALEAHARSARAVGAHAHTRADGEDGPRRFQCSQCIRRALKFLVPIFNSGLVGRLEVVLGPHFQCRCSDGLVTEGANCNGNGKGLRCALSGSCAVTGCDHLRVRALLEVLCALRAIHAHGGQSCWRDIAS